MLTQAEFFGKAMRTCQCRIVNMKLECQRKFCSAVLFHEK